MSYLIELKQKNTVTAIRHKNMITYNGKKVTKKHIEAVLRTNGLYADFPALSSYLRWKGGKAESV